MYCCYVHIRIDNTTIQALNRFRYTELERIPLTKVFSRHLEVHWNAISNQFIHEYLHIKIHICCLLIKIPSHLSIHNVIYQLPLIQTPLLHVCLYIRSYM